MSARRWTIALVSTVAAASLFAGTASAAASCGSASYSYAGLVHANPGHGVRATLTALMAPNVAMGHVAGWVGVGGVGAGPNGETEWIQVGLSGFSGGQSSLYYEITRPGGASRYTAVIPDVAPGEAHTVAVLEMFGRRDWWRVWVDRRPVSDPVYLPGSHGRWEPMATAESWNAGTRKCNRFKYLFENVKVAGAPGGGWRQLAAGYTLEDPGYRVVGRTLAGFTATSA